MPNIAIICDDWADNPEVMRRSGFVTAFLRLRHQYVSIIVCSQKWKLLSPTVRVNVTAMLCFALRSSEEVEMCIRDFSGKYGYQQTLAIYRKCTSEPFSFMFIDTLRNLFYCRFEHLVRIPGHD